MARLYLRFGEIPTGGRSECHTLTHGTWYDGAWDDLDDDRRAGFLAAGYSVDGGTIYEPGVSAFPLDWESAPDDEELTFDATSSRPDDIDFYMDGRSAYLVTGEEIGRGMNDEPLLKNAAVIGQVEVIRRRAGLISVRRVEG